MVFVAQQTWLRLKSTIKPTNKKYLYFWLDGLLLCVPNFGTTTRSVYAWKKTAVFLAIVKELTISCASDAIELNDPIHEKDWKTGEDVQNSIDKFRNACSFPIIADIDAGFGNEEATYLLAKTNDSSPGACAIQLENQVSDAKHVANQDGKRTVRRMKILLLK